jgi:hypothetical protein
MAEDTKTPETPKSEVTYAGADELPQELVDAMTREVDAMGAKPGDLIAKIEDEPEAVEETETPAEEAAKTTTPSVLDPGLVSTARQWGLSDADIGGFTSNRQLENELIRRNWEIQQQPPAAQATPAPGDEKLDDYAIPEEDLKPFDEKLVGSLKGITTYVNKVKSAYDKKVAALEKTVEAMQADVRRSAEAANRQQAEAMERMFDGFVERESPEVQQLLGKPSEVSRKPESEQYKLWASMVDMMIDLTSGHYRRSPNTQPDKHAIYCRARDAHLAEMMKKQTRADINKTLNGKRNSSALRTTHRKPTVEAVGPEAAERAVQEQMMTLGVGPWEH